MPVLEWLEAARTDLLAIVDYISDDNPDAAQHLKDDIEAKAFKLPDHPQLYRVGREPGTREMVVRSNYVVVYAEDVRAVTILRGTNNRDTHNSRGNERHGAQFGRPWRSRRFPSMPKKFMDMALFGTPRRVSFQ